MTSDTPRTDGVLNSVTGGMYTDGSEWREQVAAKGRVLVKFGTLELAPEDARVVLDALKKVGALKS